MLHNKLNNYIGLLFVFLFFVSCTPNNQTEEGKLAIIRLLVNSSNSNVNTRSGELTTTEEDVINDIHILVYNNLGELIGHKYTSYNPSNPAITVETRSSNSNCTIYAIANTGSSTYFNGKAYSEDNLKTLVAEDLSSVDGIKKGTSGNQYFLMSGSIIVSKIDPGTSTVSSSLSLSRLAAKIKFNITASNGITITDYSIKNIPKNSYLVNNTSADAATNYLSTGLTTLSAGTTSVSDQYFYMYENRKGGRTGTGTPIDQTGKALYAPVNSTYIEIHAKSSTFNGLFKIYLGADNISDYNIKRNNSYTYDIQLLGPGYADTRVTHYGFSLAANNSTSTNTAFAPGSANCYIVAPGNSVLVPVQRANESDLGLQISNVTSDEWKASLLWQTESSLISIDDASARASGCFKVTAKSSTLGGNAVVAVKDNYGKILWSWHIWVTSYDPSTSNKTYNGFVWMDRNLGATTITAATVSTFGLLYQWGRKDPFPGSAVLSAADGTRSSLYICNEQGTQLAEGGDGVKSELASGANNLERSIRYPLTYLTGTGGANIGYDWYTSTNNRSAQNDYLWGGGSVITPTNKTVYDPCPAGWRVPAWIASKSPWSGFDSTTFPWTTPSDWNIGLGRTYTAANTYYPASGCRVSNDGSFFHVSRHGFCWSSSINNCYSYSLATSQGDPNPAYNFNRADGFSVRCVKDNW